MNLENLTFTELLAMRNYAISEQRAIGYLKMIEEELVRRVKSTAEEIQLLPETKQST